MRHSDLDKTWREFAEADAREEAPASMRGAVMAAWDAERTQPAKGRAPSWRGLFLATVATGAAGVALAVTTALPGPGRASDREGFETSASAPEHAPGRPGPLVRLAADPMFENESLELVRLRVPGTSLESLGIVAAMPDASELIEVEVLVGSDGLPRAIQRLLPVVNSAHH